MVVMVVMWRVVVARAWGWGMGEEVETGNWLGATQNVSTSREPNSSMQMIKPILDGWESTSPVLR